MSAGSIALRRERMALVEDMLGRGLKTRSVVTMCGDHHGMRPRTVWRYIRAIRREWAIASNQPADEKRVTLIGRLEWAYRKEADAGNISKAAQLAIRIGEVHGLIGPGVADVSPQGDTQNVVVMVSPGEDGKVAMKQLTAAARERKRLEESH